MRSAGSPRAVSIRMGTADSLRTLRGEIEAGFPRHHHVQDQQVEFHALHQGAGLGGAGRGGHPIAIGRQIALQQGAQPLVIIHHQQMRLVGESRGQTHGCHARARGEKALAALAVFASAMLQYMAEKLGPPRKAGKPGRTEARTGSTMADVIPFDQRDGSLWYDGKLVPWKDAKTHVLTHGLHYGSCVFEGQRIYGGTHLQAEGTYRAAVLSRPKPWA